jgi:hypothetical protein
LEEEIPEAALNVGVAILLYVITIVIPFVIRNTKVIGCILFTI